MNPEEVVKGESLRLPRVLSTHMFSERFNELLWLSHEECPRPVPTDKGLVRSVHIPLLCVLLNNTLESSKPALHVAESWVHLVRCETDHWIHTQATSNVVILGKLSGSDL